MSYPCALGSIPSSVKKKTIHEGLEDEAQLVTFACHKACIPHPEPHKPNTDIKSLFYKKVSFRDKIEKN